MKIQFDNRFEEIEKVRLSAIDISNDTPYIKLNLIGVSQDGQNFL